MGKIMKGYEIDNELKINISSEEREDCQLDSWIKPRTPLVGITLGVVQKKINIDVLRGDEVYHYVKGPLLGRSIEDTFVIDIIRGDMFISKAIYSMKNDESQKEILMKF